MDRLRWGLLGTAHINRRLIPAMRAADRTTLAGVASREHARAVDYARQWDIPRVFDGYEAMLASPEVDAVYLPLPNSLHVEWAVRALAAGKHVLCEKPLALHPADVDLLGAAALAAGRVIVEGFMFRHEPLTRRVLELLRDDAIGRLVHVTSGFTYQQSRAYDVRLDPELGGGSLWDVGCYVVNYIRLAAGAEPVEACGTANTGPTGVDSSFTGLLRFSGGCTGTLFSSFGAASRTWLELHGTDGSMRVRNPFKPGPSEPIEVCHGDQVTTVAVAGSRELFVAEIEDFAACVLDGRPPVVSLADSRGNAAAIAALYDSARQGRPQAIYP